MKSIISFLILISISCLHLGALGPLPLAEKRHRKTTLPLKDALNMLALARSETRNSQSPMTAAVLFSAGYALREADVAKAKKYLEEAFELLQDADASLLGIKHLQEDLILQLTAIDPDFAESHLPDDPDLRELALQQLVTIRASKKKFERAISLLESMSSPEFALGNLMAALPKSDAADKERVFASALTSYKRQRHPILVGSNTDFGRIVVEYYKPLLSGETLAVSVQAF